MYVFLIERDHARSLTWWLTLFIEFEWSFLKRDELRGQEKKKKRNWKKSKEENIMNGK